jgi:peptidyl-prolyl cis-trans isomerase C
MFWRNRRLFLAGLSLVCAVLVNGLVPVPALGADPSPLAPGDLRRPIFDTQTPVYDAARQQEKSAGTVVAEVDGRTVTLGEVADAIRELPANVATLPFVDLYPGVLQQLIRQQALLIRAQQQALDEDPVVRRKMKAAADRVLTNELLRQEISRGITEQVLLDRYQREIAGKSGAAEVHARVIMEPTEELANRIIAELKAGADFGALAKRSSKDTTAPIGGDLGYVQLGSLNAEVGAVAFSMAAGQLTPLPINSAGVWFVLKVEDRRPRPTPSFAEVREQLVQAILREGVPDVVTKALDRVTVRTFNISGDEVTDERGK